MRPSITHSRAALAAVVLALLAGSGCNWFHRDDPGYRQSAEHRPLEVPPDLDLPGSAGATSLPPVAAAATPAAVPGTGFTVAGSREAVFEQVGQALAGIEGLTIASRAQLLGVYDVGYAGRNFLVRVSAVGAAAYVSAVDPRGVPATGEAPDKVLATLKAALVH
jgi:uncharacterized lipoprotein